MRDDMKQRRSVIVTVLVCAVSIFLFFTVPPEAQTVVSESNGNGLARNVGATHVPEGGLLYYVNTTADTVVAGACANGLAGCSLRGAILIANSHVGTDGIEIDLPTGSVINLTQALPDLTESVGITGPGANFVTVRRNTVNEYRIFNVTTGGTVTFSGLTISNGSSSLGAGIQNNSGTVNLSNCVLSDNRGNTAGGIFNNTGTVNVTNCTFTGNYTTDGGIFGGGGGGAIYNNAGIVNVTNSTFSGNEAFQGAGIFNKATGTVYITNCTLNGNQSPIEGGAIYNSGTLNVTNSTLSGNSATSVNGPGLGGGILNHGTVNIRSSIIALNTSGSGPDVFGTFTSFGFNLIGKNDGSTGFTTPTDQTGTIAVPLDPKLNPLGLQNNGGLSRTIALLSGSPAIDKGTSAGLTGNLTADQRGAGFPRTIDNPAVLNAVGGSGTDIGAFERRATSVVDFDGDGRSDISVFRPSAGIWFLLRSQFGFDSIQFGVAADRLTPADFDGDGRTDIAVFRPSNGTWFRLNSSTGAFFFEQFGLNGDLPVPGDFDGDGKADLAVFRPSTNAWFWKNSSNGVVTGRQFGATGDKPLMGDFDGDGKADVALYRPSDGGWYRLNSSNGSFFATAFGIAEDKPTPADYDGDGKTDISVFRPTTGAWYRLNSGNGSFSGVGFGQTGDIPAAADYDGDGRADIAVFRPSNGYWFLLSSMSGFSAQSFGISEDRPVPSAFVQ